MDEELEAIRKRKARELMEKIRSEKMETEIEVDDDDFEEKVLKQSSKVPVVVDFWAVWCAPCLILGPTLEKLAEEYAGKFILAKVDVGKNQSMAQRYGIMSIPNIKLFKDGKVADEFIGVMPEQAVKAWIDKNIKKG